MKILTKEILKKLPKTGSQDGKGEDMMMWVKLFTPWTHWTWWIAEYDPETGECFGLVDGFEKELGYFSLDEIMSLEGPGGLRVERDKFYEPTTLREVRLKS